MCKNPEEIDVGTWEEFNAGLETLSAQPNTAQFSDLPLPLLFRGQENSIWPLSTTLERNGLQNMPFHDYYRIIARVKPQIESFTGKEWQIPSYPEVEKECQEFDGFSLKLTFGRLPGYAYMAYLRHHGFPSPLLDWSRSPFVAAYFAFNRPPAKMGDKVSIYVFSEARTRGGSNQQAFIHRLGPYVGTHKRHFLQQSEYTMSAIFDSGWRFSRYEEAFYAHSLNQDRFWKFNIPSSERTKVLTLFDKYNLNALSLFESEESLMETLASREFQRERP